MFKTGDPNLKLFISDPTKVPACYNQVAKIMAKSKMLGTAIQVRAICANAEVADSWAAFVRTLGVEVRKVDNVVTFFVSAEDIKEMPMPKVAFKRAVKLGA